MIAVMGRQAKVKREVVRYKPLELYSHQQSVVDRYVQEQIRRFYLVWHRRAGKDVFALEFARERMEETVGNYWHLFPFHVQAKRAIWKGIDKRTGQRFIDRAFPNRIKSRDNDTEMSIVMPNGSTWQMLGSDNYDRMVGSNPAGVSFSEWALCDPAAWDYIRPILLENKGWALFITTYRGRNHAYRMCESLKESPGWYVDVRTIEQTSRLNGDPIVTAEDVAQEIRDGMDPALARQEFYCDPDAATSGAIFSRQHALLSMRKAIVHANNNRIIRVAWGTKAEGIAATVFQENQIIACHSFLEQNLADAVSAVARRHPNNMLVHHAVNPDRSLFSALDGHGVVDAPISANEHAMHGHCAAMLNTCQMTSIARERLLDLSMSYAPFRDQLDETELTNDALMTSIAVMHTAQKLRKVINGPQDYSQYDRGVI